MKLKCQLLGCVRLFATPQTAAHQASLFFTVSWSLLKLMSIKSAMPPNHLILCHPLLLLFQYFPGSASFLINWLFASGGQSIGVSTSASVQFSSVAQSCPTLGDPMNRSTPGLPVHHQLPESTQTHVYCVSDAIQPSHPLSSPSPPASGSFQMSQLFASGGQSIGVSASMSVLPMNNQD